MYSINIKEMDNNELEHVGKFLKDNNVFCKECKSDSVSKHIYNETFYCSDCYFFIAKYSPDVQEFPKCHTCKYVDTYGQIWSMSKQYFRYCEDCFVEQYMMENNELELIGKFIKDNNVFCKYCKSDSIYCRRNYDVYYCAKCHYEGHKGEYCNNLLLKCHTCSKMDTYGKIWNIEDNPWCNQYFRHCKDCFMDQYINNTRSRNIKRAI